MDSATILEKTPKGEEEIAKRSFGLDRNLRYLLILVDGQSSVGELQAKGAGLKDIQAGLESLASDGFIRAEGAAPADAPAPSGQDLADIKQELIRIARSVLGNDADKVVEKLQAAPDTKEDIQQVMSKCQKTVKLLIDENKAAELIARCKSYLDSL